MLHFLVYCLFLLSLPHVGVHSHAQTHSHPQPTSHSETSHTVCHTCTRAHGRGLALTCTPTPLHGHTQAHAGVEAALGRASERSPRPAGAHRGDPRECSDDATLHGKKAPAGIQGTVSPRECGHWGPGGPGGPQSPSAAAGTGMTGPRAPRCQERRPCPPPAEPRDQHDGLLCLLCSPSAFLTLKRPRNWPFGL